MKISARRYKTLLPVLLLAFLSFSIYAHRMVTTVQDNDPVVTWPAAIATAPSGGQSGSPRKPAMAAATETVSDQKTKASVEAAQPRLSLPQSVLPGGGGTSTNGSNSLTGTMGQGFAGALSGGQFTLGGGFWGGVVGAPGPAIAGLTPSLATAGGAAFTLTVTGANFVAGTKVRWNGSERPTDLGSVTMLLAQIPATDIAAAGVIAVTVINPDGQISAGANFTVNSLACSFSLSPVTASFPATGGTGTVSVTASSPACAWTATSNAPWLAITDGISGTGDGTVSYTVQPNNNPEPRNGSLYIAGLTNGHLINQQGQSGAAAGLQFYPLARPLRLLDTRPAVERPGPAFATPGVKLAGLLSGGTPRTQLARVSFDSQTIPAEARVIAGTATALNFPAPSQYDGTGNLTFYPSETGKPEVSNINYAANQTVSNSFTVGLSGSGAFDIFAYSDVHLVVDVVGYYAPPGAGGLYYHPLPRPVRLLETRANPIFTGCVTPRAPLVGGDVLTQQGRLTCDGVTIPAAAQVLVGNLTSVNAAAAGLATVYAGDQSAPPLINSLAYVAMQAVPNAFVTRLDAHGMFKLTGSQTSDFLIDIAGYFSPEAQDANGLGLLFTQLPLPVRLLETRPETFYPGCYTPRTPLAGGSELVQSARITCEGVTIPATAQAILGNATVVNFLSPGSGNVTLYPSAANRPDVSNLNYVAEQVIPNAFTVGLSNEGRFTIYVFSTIHLLIDLTGYYAP